MKIKQGDAYDIQVKLVDGDGSLISIDNNAQMVEFMIGNLRKTCPGEAEEAVKEWVGSGEYMYNSITCDGNDMIIGDGIGQVFAVGDLVDIILDSPVHGGHGLNTDPLVYRSSRSQKVLATHESTGDEDNDYIILEHGECWPHTNDGDIIPFTRGMTVRSTEYVLPLSQQDTFSLEGVVPFEARVKFADSQVVGTSLGAVVVEHSMSREVL